jgi:RNA polymerase sigma-70 factor (ECF subfamily)
MDGPQAIPIGDRHDRVSGASDQLAAAIDRRIDGAYRLATVVLGNSMEAEDVVADAALAAWRARSTLRDPDRLDAWFARIVVNACRDRLRARRRHPVTTLGDVDRRRAADLGDFREPIHERDRILRGLESLGPDERIVVTLRFWADLQVDAIAERMGVPSGTVKSRLNRALGRLRVVLDAGDDER